MTYIEKAKELIKKYQAEKMIAYQPYAGANVEYSELNHDEAKKCALIAVDEVIAESSTHNLNLCDRERTSWWQEVKKELELL